MQLFHRYVHKGTLFKFATDWQKMYGGDVYAMKVASHELKVQYAQTLSAHKANRGFPSKGLTRYMSCGIHELRFPLMALIDYRGFRLTAQSILPIKDNTLGTFVVVLSYHFYYVSHKITRSVWIQQRWQY